MSCRQTWNRLHREFLIGKSWNTKPLKFISVCVWGGGRGAGEGADTCKARVPPPSPLYISFKFISFHSRLSSNCSYKCNHVFKKWIFNVDCVLHIHIQEFLTFWYPRTPKSEFYALRVPPNQKFYPKELLLSIFF